MTSKNPGDYTNKELCAVIERGGRLVIYPYCISLIVVTLRRHSPVHVVHPGQSRFGMSLPWALILFSLGWWGIPWGIFFTPMALWRALSGDIDLTDEWRNNYDDAVRAEEAGSVI